MVVMDSPIPYLSEGPTQEIPGSSSEVLKGGFYFHPGEDVLVRGSGGSSGAELNGQAGQIIAYVPERGLYKVLVAGKEILVKESDLALPHPEWDHDHSQIN